MNKYDRAKMVKRLCSKFRQWPFLLARISWFVASEVDRAVSAERKAFRDTEELRIAHLRRIDGQMIERMRKGKR